MKNGKYENFGQIRGDSDPKPKDQEAELNPTWGSGQVRYREYSLQDWIKI